MTAKLNRAARCTAAVLAAVAVGAGAVACDASSGSSAAGSSARSGTHSGTAKDSASGTAKDSSGSEQGGSGDEGTSGADASAKGSSGGEVKTAQQGSQTDAVNTSSSARSSSRCHTGDLRYSFDAPHGGRPDMDTTYQQVASVKLTNNSERTCTLHGFPGVRLVSTTGEAWDLRRSADTPSTITLRPGDDTAIVSMNILPVAKDDQDTKPFVPGKILLTPPNETTHVTLEWPWGGAILDQSGATRPGTFVNPIGVG